MWISKKRLEEIKKECEALERANSRLQDQVLDLQTLLNFSNENLRESQEAGLRMQQVIQNHDNNCLPQLVFTP